MAASSTGSETQGAQPAGDAGAPPDAEVSSRTQAWVSVFSGAGIGLMVGVLLGLSLSPVVGAFVAAIGTALAVLLGLNDQHFSVAKGLRIGSFGLAVIAGATAGIYVRANDLLSPSFAQRQERKAEYLKLGYSEREALDILSGQTRLTPAGDAAAAKAQPRQVSHTISGLFASPLEISACSQLKTAFDATLSADEVVSNFATVDGAGWRELATETAAQLQGDDRKALLFIARDAACVGDSPPRLSDAQCKALPPQAAMEKIEAAFSSAPALRTVPARVTAEVSAPGRPAAYHLLHGVFCAKPK
jgi:hypothetical protein